MSLTPQAELARVVEGLIGTLPARYATVLADERWEEVAAALRRLAVPGAAAAVARGLGPDESARLAALLLDRWTALGGVEVPPALELVGPVTVPVGGSVEVRLLVAGLEDGWTTSWSGNVDPAGGSSDDVVRVTPRAPGPVRVTVRVFGRSHHGRTVLGAVHVLTATDPDDGGGSGASD